MRKEKRHIILTRTILILAILVLLPFAWKGITGSVSNPAPFNDHQLSGNFEGMLPCECGTHTVDLKLQNNGEYTMKLTHSTGDLAEETGGWQIENDVAGTDTLWLVESDHYFAVPNTDTLIVLKIQGEDIENGSDYPLKRIHPTYAHLNTH